MTAAGTLTLFCKAVNTVFANPCRITCPCFELVRQIVRSRQTVPDINVDKGEKAQSDDHAHVIAAKESFDGTRNSHAAKHPIQNATAKAAIDNISFKV